MFRISDVSYEELEKTGMEAHTAHYRMPYLKFERLPVIHIPRRYHEVEQLALLVADKVQHKPEEPAHGTLAPLDDSP